MRILVTGASGKAGKWVVRDLVDNGHDVLATDLAPKLPDCPSAFTRADLTDYGQTMDIMRGSTPSHTWPTFPRRSCSPTPTRSTRTTR